MLVVANLVPLVGVLFFGWSVATVLIAYWLENGVIGLINIPKILLAGRDADQSWRLSKSAPLAAFFVIHYGVFWLVHGLFVFFLTGFAALTGGLFYGVFSNPDAGTSLIEGQAVGVMVLLLLVSHGTSFVVNYVGRREYETTTPAKQMFEPYGRLVILHVTIVFGAFFVIFLGQPVALVALLVLFKTIGDLLLHLREHQPALTAGIDGGLSSGPLPER